VVDAFILSQLDEGMAELWHSAKVRVRVRLRVRKPTLTKAF